MKILVINGPNLNLLGLREKKIYGEETYEDLLSFIRHKALKAGVDIAFFQSNYEGAIIEEIQKAYGVYDGIIINPAGYTHSSVAILDALKAVDIPTVEVHISDIYAREDFRKVSYVSLAALKVISGHGFKGYEEALMFLKEYLSGK